MPGRLRCSTLFPYTTLFRSDLAGEGRRCLPPRVAALRKCNSPRDDRKHQQCRRRDEHRQESPVAPPLQRQLTLDRKSTRLNSSHVEISYAVFCLTKKKRTRS